MASTSEGARLTEQHRLAQQQVRNDMLVEFLAMWALLDSTRLDDTGPAWVQAVMPLIRRYRLRSAEVAADYFGRFSAVEAPAGPTPGRIEFPPSGRPAAPPPTRPTPTRRQPARTPEPVRSSRIDTSQVAPRDRRVRWDLDESVFGPRIEGERRTRIEVPDIDWAPSDRAARVSLTVTGPVGQKSKAARGKPLQQARDESFVQAAGAATRHVLTGGRQSLLTLIENDTKAIGWIRVTDGDPCAFCAMLASRGPVYRSEQTASFTAHDACVLPGTVVTGPRTEAAYRRWYEGELIVLTTAAGDKLSITPNHPVLTRQGWVDAGLLREGDDVVGRSGTDLASLQVPHENEQPALIEDVWRAYSVDGLRAVPVTAQDFHGDGMGSKGDVEVVAPHGQFPYMIDLPIAQQLAQAVTGRTGATAVLDALLTSGSPLDRLLGPLGSANRGVRRSGMNLALLGGQSGLMHKPGSGQPTALHPRVLQPPLHHGPRDAVSGSQLVLGDARVVVGHEPVVRRFDPSWAPPAPLGTGMDAATLKNTAERARIHADLGGALLERLAGGVQLSRVTDLRRVHYSGHVLNLRTAEGWYDANRIIVSNCACTAEPVYSRDTLWPGRAAEFRRLYREVTAETSGRDSINAFRRAYERQQRETRRTEVA